MPPWVSVYGIAGDLSRVAESLGTQGATLIMWARYRLHPFIGSIALTAIIAAAVVYVLTLTGPDYSRSHL